MIWGPNLYHIENDHIKWINKAVKLYYKNEESIKLPLDVSLAVEVKDDDELERIRNEYVSGDLLTGEIKSICVEKATTWMKNHHELKDQNQHLVKEFLK